MVIPTDPCERCGQDPQHCGCEEKCHDIEMDSKNEYCEVAAEGEVINLAVDGDTFHVKLTFSPGEAKRIGEALCRVVAYILAD